MTAADTLRRLSPGGGAVIVHPTPIDSSGMTKEQWTRARYRLRETWARLGLVRQHPVHDLLHGVG
ncbi:hypothetical protein [Streptomyces noursei]|uniref:hypothetical protein n=1 Tax=Streptomyces noursei TaxID=1971 RepID=UPI001672BA5B|nr:hypothetical protein [Streptomyces noursei]MCZ1021371.1 hypothetical protein [Streptomyces noursei]GGX54429.1 hypothetical protein GCM10010341_89430 [Streptomyces noursei]